MIVAGVPSSTGSRRSSANDPAHPTNAASGVARPLRSILVEQPKPAEGTPGRAAGHVSRSRRSPARCAASDPEPVTDSTYVHPYSSEPSCAPDRGRNSDRTTMRCTPRCSRDQARDDEHNALRAVAAVVEAPRRGARDLRPRRTYDEAICSGSDGDRPAFGNRPTTSEECKAFGPQRSVETAYRRNAGVREVGARDVDDERDLPGDPRTRPPSRSRTPARSTQRAALRPAP